MSSRMHGVLKGDISSRSGLARGHRIIRARAIVPPGDDSSALSYRRYGMRQQQPTKTPPEFRCYSRWHWRRWHLTRWVFGRLYWLGITSNGGSSGNHCHLFTPYPDPCQGHSPKWGWVAHGPGWGSLLRPRVYILGWEVWKWGCLLRRHHWPGEHIGLGACGKCAPWPCCGATTLEHAVWCEGEQ